MGNDRAVRPVRCEIGMLPNEVIIDIASRVASCSLRDLFNCRQSCKLFNRCGRDPLVLRQALTQDIYTRRFELEEHREAAYAFLELCADSGNPGALYGQGLECCDPLRPQIRYFGGTDEPYGLECLEKSASLGHTPAAYVLVVVLLCSSEQDQDQVERAMNTIRAVRDSAGASIMECRLEFVRFLHNTPPLARVASRFKFPKRFMHPEPRQCPCRMGNPFSVSVFLLRDAVDAGSCLLCLCEFEAKFFCSLFNLRRWRLD